MTKIESISLFLFIFFFYPGEEILNSSNILNFQQQNITENKIKKSKWKRIEENLNFMRGPRNQDVRK